MRKFYDIETREIITEDVLDDTLEELKECDPLTYGNITLGLQKVKDNYSICYFMPDIAKFKGTAWAGINAMADMIDHSAPNRNTANYEENRWGKIMDGHILMDEFVKLVNAKVGVGA